MILLFDVGNTHTHVALANAARIWRHADLPTAAWFSPRGSRWLKAFVRGVSVTDAALCSVVPRATACVKRVVRSQWGMAVLEVSAKNLPGVRVDYPQPSAIGPDRLANAVAARQRYGAPVVVLDFGTALTFDVVDHRDCYIGGVIAPGLAAMASYLPRHTALLPEIRLRGTMRAIGRSTAEAMRIGVVRGYGGLVRELLGAVRRALGNRPTRLVATGGYARWIAPKLPEIEVVDPLLTLEGVRLVWQWSRSRRRGASSTGCRRRRALAPTNPRQVLRRRKSEGSKM